MAEKIKRLKARPDITFTDFGTRRRFSKAWHEYVLERLASELPNSQFIGTSNAYFAMKLGLLPMGTSAHERDMVVAGFLESLGNSENIQKLTDNFVEQVDKDLATKEKDILHN